MPKADPPRVYSVKMLKKDKNGSPEWLSKLPQMAKQLEVSLYRNARSFEAYMDVSTLKQRLQQIAVEVSRKARNQGDSRDDRQKQMRGMDMSGSSQPQQQSMPSNNRQIVNPNDINPMANGNSGGMNNMGAMPNMNNMGGSNNFQNQRNMGNNANRGLSTASSASLQPSTGQNRNDPEWKIRIRHKQQRLLLLHHSAKCPHDDGRCTVTPHCGDMKRLWKHMEGCKDNQCRVPHCFSSRAILSHYRKCKDPACPACGPVRETVRKSQNRNSSGSGGRIRSGTNAGSGGLNPAIGGGRMGSGSMPAAQGMMGSTDVNSSRNNNFPSIGNSFQQNSPQNGSSKGATSQANSNPGGMQFPSMQSAQQPVSNAQGQFGSMNNNNSSGTGGNLQALYRSNDNKASGSASDSSQITMKASGSGRRNDTEWQKVRHKQQRLLLLRHASRCQYKGKCPVTPHCASMKKLWEHIAHCKNQQCSVPHCMSSRYVLSHYRRCKDPRCPACTPVRETIKKSHEREKGLGQASGDVNAFDVDTTRAPNSMGSGLSSAPLGGPGLGASPDYAPAPKRSKMDHPAGGNASLGPGSLAPMAMSSGVPSLGPSSSMSASKIGSGVASISATSKPETAKSQGSAAKGSSDHSLLNGFTVEQLTTHLASLNRASQLPPAKLKQKCSEVLKGLQTHQHGWVFNCPVDPVELGLPDYFEVIKKPMDLGTIQKKLDSGAYHQIEDFQTDTNLTFENAMAYNEAGTVVYDMAKELKIKFEDDFKKLEAQLEAEDQERRQNDRACVLCGCEKRLFEPPVFFCNGMNCASKRIRRNSHFYIGGNNQYFWCNQCFNELDEKSPIELIDLSVQKSDLTKKKNDEVHEESWVQCDVCNRWIHQICGLFNTRQNKEHHSEYCCPLCLLDKKKKNQDAQLPKPPGAAELPRTKLSEFLENHVASKIDAKRHSMAQDKVKNEVSRSFDKC